jgi:hypothetical protein
MRQYSYSIINPQGCAYVVHCTAANPEWARAQVAHSYSGWFVCEQFCDINPPHRIYGEIDASDMCADDYDWIMSQSAV